MRCIRIYNGELQDHVSCHNLCPDHFYMNVINVNIKMFKANQSTMKKTKQNRLIFQKSSIIKMFFRVVHL